MRTLARAGLVAGLSLAAFGVAPGIASADSIAPSCDWMEQYNGTIAELGADPAYWQVKRPDPGTDWAGLYDPATNMAYVNPDMPCDIVSSTVKHEWSHSQEDRLYGDDWSAAMAAYQTSENMELLADCASLLLGATYTPYVDAAGGCTTEQLAYARYLIGYEVKS